MLLHVLFLAPRWPNKHFGGGGRRKGREWKPTTKREEKRGEGKRSFAVHTILLYYGTYAGVCLSACVVRALLLLSPLPILFPRRTQTTGWRKNASFSDKSIRFSEFRHRLGPANKKSYKKSFLENPVLFSTNLYHYIHFSPPHSLPIPPLENKFSRFPSLPPFDPSR